MFPVFKIGDESPFEANPKFIRLQETSCAYPAGFHFPQTQILNINSLFPATLFSARYSTKVIGNELTVLYLPTYLNM